MTTRFIKFIPSEEADYLQQKHPFASLLLMQIARRARRTDGHPDGLKIGEAQIGDFLNAGLSTRKQYRWALQILVERKHIEIIGTCRSRKTIREVKCQNRAIKGATESTTGITTIGTKVKLLSSSVWDLNIQDDDDRNNEIKGHQKGHRGATEGPRTRRDKKDKKEKEKIKKENLPLEKISVREFVTLTPEQHAKLLEAHGEEKLSRMLDMLNAYKGQTGKEYTSDFHTMINGGWVLKEVSKPVSIQKAAPQSAKEMVCAKFVHNKIYGNYECYINDFEICFVPQIGHSQPHVIKFNSNNFTGQLQLLIEKLKIGVKL